MYIEKTVISGYRWNFQLGLGMIAESMMEEGGGREWWKRVSYRGIAVVV